LIQRTEPKPREDRKREYHHFYEISPQLREQLQGKQPEQFTACRVHNLRKKLKILSQSKELSLDKRAGYQKSWKIKGPMRHKFWYPGKAGMPSVTVDYHIKTLVVYVDKKQTIVARDPNEALEIGWRAIYSAVDLFIEQQKKFGVLIEVPHTGETIGEPHGGFVGSDNPAMEEGVTKKNWWIDRSQEAELGPGHPELETNKPENMTRLDNLIKVSEQVDLTALPNAIKDSVKIAMPEAMREMEEKFGKLTNEVMTVMAFVQSGMTVQHQVQQLTFLVAKQLEDNNQLRKENEELRRIMMERK
jgi:hypothetical protein